jgi:sarcosine oxidase subunit gamma
MPDMMLGRAPPLLAAPADGTRRVLAPMGRFSLRLPEDDTPANLAALGLTLPGEPCRAAQSSTASALWLGPGEWLILTDDPRLSGALAAERAGRPFSLTDIGHRQIGLAVTGPRAAWWLNALCPLDLDIAAFPVGMCTRTVFAKAEIVLWRTAPAAFHLEVWRSFAPYVWELLNIVAAEPSDMMENGPGTP